MIQLLLSSVPLKKFILGCHHVCILYRVSKRENFPSENYNLLKWKFHLLNFCLLCSCCKAQALSDRAPSLHTEGREEKKTSCLKQPINSNKTEFDGPMFCLSIKQLSLFFARKKGSNLNVEVEVSFPLPNSSASIMTLFYFRYKGLFLKFVGWIYFFLRLIATAGSRDHKLMVSQVRISIPSTSQQLALALKKAFLFSDNTSLPRWNEDYSENNRKPTFPTEEHVLSLVVRNLFAFTVHSNPPEIRF